MPTRQSTHEQHCDDAQMIALETQDDLVQMYAEVDRFAAAMKRMIRQAIATNGAIQKPIDGLRTLTLVAPRGRAQGGAA